MLSSRRRQARGTTRRRWLEGRTRPSVESQDPASCLFCVCRPPWPCPRRVLVSAQPQQPDARRLGDLVGRRQQGVAAQGFEGAGQALGLALQVTGDRVTARRRGARVCACNEGGCQVAFFTRLQPDLVEVGVAQAAKQAGGRGLGDIGHAGQLGGRVGQHVVGPVEQQGRQFPLARGKLLQMLLDGQCQAGGHGRVGN